MGNQTWERWHDIDEAVVDMFPHTNEGKEAAIRRFGDRWAEHIDFWADDQVADGQQVQTDAFALDAVAIAVMTGEASATEVDIHAVDAERTAQGLPRAFMPAVSYSGNEAEVVFPAQLPARFIHNIPA